MRPTNNHGAIAIRFTKFGYKYSLHNLGKFSHEKSVTAAYQICAAIETDISLGRFVCKNNDELFRAYHPLAKLSSHHDANIFADDAITMIEKHIKTLTYKDRVLSPVLSLLRNYGKPIKSRDDAQKFWVWMTNDGKRSANSNNRYLEALAPICPMFSELQRCKRSQTKVEKPFSKDEIASIIAVFDKEYPEYRVFVRFLFATGVRTSEAIALTFDSINWDENTVTISESIGTAMDGKKVRKATKTGITRIIPIGLKLKTLLAVEYEIYSKNGNTHNLVFAPSGTLINANNFRARHWTKALESAKVPYRTLYNTRHTFCSHFLNETPDFIKLASITHGTKSGVQTLIKHYAHLVSKVSMPDLF